MKRTAPLPRILWLLFVAIIFSSCREESSQWQFARRIELQGVLPLGLVSTPDHHWVSDPENNRIVKIDGSGKILETYEGFHRPMHLSGSGNNLIVPEFLTDSIKLIELSDGEIQLLDLDATPDGPAAVDRHDGHLAVADFFKHRIIIQGGETVQTIGEEGHQPGQLYYPTDVAMDEARLYVADAYNNRVQVFDPEGNVQQVIGAEDSLQVASGLFVSASEIFATDFFNNRVLIYDKQGLLKQILTDGLSHPSDMEVRGDSLFITNFKDGSISVYAKQ